MAGGGAGFPGARHGQLPPSGQDQSSSGAGAGAGLPGALVNCLFLLGWNDGTEQEIFTVRWLDMAGAGAWLEVGQGQGFLAPAKVNCLPLVKISPLLGLGLG
eukprot:gene2803-12678_t